MPSVKDARRITETWWKNSYDEETTMDGYKYFRKIRKEEEELELYFV